MQSLTDGDWPEPLEKFDPVEVLSVGRLSTVVHARHESTGRDVALKLLHEHLASEGSVRRRLHREFGAVRRLDHRAIVAADDLIEEGDTVALVMDFVDGVSVREYVAEQGPMSWEKARPVIDDMLAGLEHAHDAGIWHRDLNAEHVLITDGGAVIVGFGIAKVDELAALTMHTRVLGALEAMAPERVLGMDYDGRADLYSAGAVAHELLLGHPPIEGTMRSALEASRRERIAELPEQLPRQAQYLLERSLVGDDSTRFATTAQMRRTLEGMYDEEMWQRWSCRDIETCPECESPVLEAIDRCIECGHEFRRLIREPGAGVWKVRVLSQADAFVPEVPFETNMEPDVLTETELQSLMDLLAGYDDTRRFADGRHDYRYPPYILAQQLSEEDATRLADLLEEANIEHEIFENAHGDHATTPGGSAGRKYRFAAVYTGVCTLGVLLFFHTMLELPWELVGWLLPLFGAGLLVGGYGVRYVLPAAGAQHGDSESSAMIPTRLLTSAGRIAARDLVPDEFAEILEKTERDGLRRDLFELATLALEVASELDGQQQREVRLLLEQVAALGSQLETMHRSLEQTLVPQLVEQLEAVNHRIETGEDDDEQQRNRRDELLAQLQRHDEEAAELTAIRGQLTKVRGMLLDMRGDVWEQIVEHDMMLEFGEDPGEAVEQLQLQLEAQREVREAL